MLMASRSVNPAFVLLDLLFFSTFPLLVLGLKRPHSVAVDIGVSDPGERFGEDGERGRTSEKPMLDYLPGSQDEISLVAHLDGEIHLVELESRRSRWSFNCGPPLTSSYQRPSSGAEDCNYSSGFDGKHETEKPISKDDFHIYCGEDWDLYMYSKNHGSQKLTVSPDKFVPLLPQISDAGDIIIGSTKTTAFLVNARTGEVNCRYGLDKEEEVTSKATNNQQGSVAVPEEGIGAWIETSTRKHDESIFVTRTDYCLTSYAPCKTVLWNVTISEIEVAFLCQDSTVGGINFEGDDSFRNPIKCREKVPISRTRGPKVIKDGVTYVLDRFPSSELIVQQQFLDDHRKNLKAPVELGKSKLLSYLHDKAISVSRLQNSQGDLALLPSYYDKVDCPGVVKENDTSYGASQNDSIFISLTPAFVFFVTDMRIISLVVLILSMKYYSQPSSLTKRGQIGGKKRRSRRDSRISDLQPQKEVQEVEAHGPAISVTTEKDPLFKLINRNGGRGRMIGNLFVSNIEIAKGSNGTVVLEGVHNGRLAAVKRLVRAHSDIASKEVEALLESDNHPNIVRWYGVDYDSDFVYLSLERCSCSLNDLIELHAPLSQEHSFCDNPELDIKNKCGSQLGSTDGIGDVVLWKENGYPSNELLGLMRDMVSGLSHLHDLKIIHRDLKPHNVLISAGRPLCAKLSDMGISRKLSAGKSFLTNNATGNGSSGWQAPELLLGGSQTFALDFFSLGCVLFFCVTKGSHPFGRHFERDTNIAKNQLDLSLVEHVPEAVHLFSELLQPEPQFRPTANELLHHPFFWSSEMRLSFLRDSSDRIELEDREKQCDLLEAIEHIGPVTFGESWDTKFDSVFLSSIGNHRRYNVNSARHLLRLIRNKWNHYIEFPKQVKDYLGDMPEGFDDYFASRFPKLLIEVYKVIYEYCREEKYFEKYFKGKNR